MKPKFRVKDIVIDTDEDEKYEILKVNIKGDRISYDLKSVDSGEIYEDDVDEALELYERHKITNWQEELK